MARTGFIHHIGTFFLLAATVLLIITDISAPVVSSISLLRIELSHNRVRTTEIFDNDADRSPSIAFGTFGYCAHDVSASGSKFCSDSRIGYDPVAVIERNNLIPTTSGQFSDYAHDTAKSLTKVMVLHPIATGLAFIAFLMALGSGFVGSFLAALGAFITFLVVAVVLVTDFVSFSIIRSAVNDYAGDIKDIFDGNDGNGNGATRNTNVVASWGAAIWTTLAAAVLCLLATVILLFTCCSARRHRRRESQLHQDKYASSPVATTTTRRRRRWF